MNPLDAILWIACFILAIVAIGASFIVAALIRAVLRAASKTRDGRSEDGGR